MPETSHVDAKTVGGPYFPGRAIYALFHDQRNGRNRLWAAVNSSFWGGEHTTHHLKT